MSTQYEEQSQISCQFDAPAVLAAIDQLAGLIEDLRAGLASMDQKLTQLRTVEHQHLLQTVKQLRSAMDMATRDNKRQLETLTGKLLEATVRVQSLDLALSNQKLEQLAERTERAKAETARSDKAKGGKASASEKAAR